VEKSGSGSSGGARTTAAALAVLFDRDGKVCESSYSEQK